ncbi:probable calcium-binding protein CML11 [Argentina anserina]|uniref:probable calcium-binding protein CML11 n=1 Tax=Argentina anserina TaxID=57926 RepID=UPI0021762D9E|nr:probable calcium-binding protein CML11 [Potentilla anserina]
MHGANNSRSKARHQGVVALQFKKGIKREDESYLAIFSEFDDEEPRPQDDMPKEVAAVLEEFKDDQTTRHGRIAHGASGVRPSKASFVPIQTTSKSTATNNEVKKYVRSVMTTTREKDPELKRVFATFDKNNDGFITKQGLKESLKNIRVFMSDEEVEEMVKKVDINRDGLIDFSEFCLLCQGQSIMNGGEAGSEASDVDQEEELKEAFDVFDKDKDGLISVEELRVDMRSKYCQLPPAYMVCIAVRSPSWWGGRYTR